MSLEDDGWQRLGGTSEFPIGSVTAAKMQGEYGNTVEIAVVRTDAGLDVIVDRCPHQGGALTERGCINDDNQLVCTWHNWIFNLPQGTDTELPGIQLQGIQSKIEDGSLWVLADADLF